MTKVDNAVDGDLDLLLAPTTEDTNGTSFQNYTIGASPLGIHIPESNTPLIGPILWGHSGPLSRVVVVVVDIDAQAACDSSDT